MKSTISIPTHNASVLTTPGFETETQSSKEDLFLLDAMNQQINGVLGQFQYIGDLLDTDKKVAPVENKQREVDKALDKIQALLNQEPGVEADLAASARNTSGADLGLETNPLLKEDLGGMPLEDIAAEWKDFIEGISDPTELENKAKEKRAKKIQDIKEKLQAKFKHRARLANRLKATNKPSLKNAPKNTPKPGLTPQFKQVIKVLNRIENTLKERPAPPAPAPRIVEAPRPRPGGF